MLFHSTAFQKLIQGVKIAVAKIVMLLHLSIGLGGSRAGD
jgi:hypothetical protein